MTEAQLRAFPPFKTLPILDPGDGAAESVTAGHGGTFEAIRSCSTLREVEACLNDPRFVPLGGVRAAVPGGHIVVAYFGKVV